MFVCTYLHVVQNACIEIRNMIGSLALIELLLRVYSTNGIIFCGVICLQSSYVCSYYVQSVSKHLFKANKFKTIRLYMLLPCQAFWIESSPLRSLCYPKSKTAEWIKYFFPWNQTSQQIQSSEESARCIWDVVRWNKDLLAGCIGR